MNDFRQPLSVLPLQTHNGNATPNRQTLSPAKSNKRTHTTAGFDAKVTQTGVVTPTKPSATVIATNGRRSVKRVRTEAVEDADAESIRLRAEADNVARVKAWCEQYKKVFPTLRFYFDNCSDEDVRRCTRKINQLRGVKVSR